MIKQTLTDILTRHAGAKNSAEEILIPETLELTVFAAVGESAVTIHHVVSLFLNDDAVLIVTKRGEHYALEYADVRLVKYTQNKSRAGAGYAAV